MQIPSTVNVPEHWRTPKSSVEASNPVDCYNCLKFSTPYVLSKLLIALSWLTPPEVKAVKKELRRTLRPKEKLHDVHSVVEAVRGALNSKGLPFRPKLRGQVIVLEPFMGKTPPELVAAAELAKRNDRLYPLRYRRDLHPRLVKVKRVEEWGILALTENGHRSFRWSDFEKTPFILPERIERLKERHSLSLTALKPQPAPKAPDLRHHHARTLDHDYF